MSMEEHAIIEEATTAEDFDAATDWYGASVCADRRGQGDSWSDEDAPETGDAAEEERFTLKHLGQEFDVSRVELITLAQKGKDYDRIRARADALAAAQNANHSASSADSAHDEYCDRRDGEIQEFVSEYGGVSPEDIPPEVWSEVLRGRPLLGAYQAFENRALKARIMADMQNHENRLRSTGSRATAGKAQERGELESDWYCD